MPFLFPGLLGLTALAAVPVIIHLLNRQRYKRVRWAAMKFLLDVMREETKRIQYKDLLLMFLRALACALVALAVARPITRMLAGGDMFGGARRAALIVMDNSGSMNLSSGTETLFEQAKRQAVSIVRQLPSKTSVGIVEASAPAGVLLKRSADRGEIEDMIEELAPTDGGTDVIGALRRVEELVRNMEDVSGCDLFFLTDLQALPWTRDAEAVRRQVQKMGSGLRRYVARIGQGGENNLAVSDLNTDFPVVSLHEPFWTGVTVINGGPEPESSVAVDLLLDGTVLGSKNVESLRPGETIKLGFLAEIAALGDHLIEATVNRARGRLAADDTRRLVVSGVQDMKVLLVDGQPGEKFGDGETDYLDAVLRPLAEKEEQTAQIRAFAVNKVPADSVQPAQVREAEVVVLANVASPGRELVRELHKRVAEGGGLIVFLGDNVRPAEYNQLFEKAPEELFGEKTRDDTGKDKKRPKTTETTETKREEAEKTGEPLMPAAVGEAIPEARTEPGAGNEPVYLYLSPERLEHPWMSFFLQKQYKDYLRVPVKRALSLNLEKAPATRVVARYTDGSPAVVEKTYGEGRICLVGTTADMAWNQWFAEPLGPILFKRLVTGVMAKSAVAKTADVGQRLQIPMSPEERKLPVHMLDPFGKLHTVRPETVKTKPVLVFEGLRRAGAYRVTVETIPPRTELLALNMESEESDVRTLDEKAFGDLFPGNEFRFLRSETGIDLGSALRQRRIGMELWWPALLLGLLVFIVEIVLGRIFTKEAPSRDELPRIARIAQRMGPAGSAVARGAETEKRE